MREILFRGKPIVPGKHNGGSFAIGYYCCSPSGKHYIEFPTASGYRNPVEVNPTTVGQYTGLTDKNGKKIFEGDIVHCYGKDSIRAYDWKAVVEFGNPNSTYSWGWQLKPITNVDGNPDILLWVEMSDYMDIYCEVIGNIHDNPELLEDET